MQAAITRQAIQQGCNVVLLEVPGLFVAELSAIMDQGGDDERIRNYIREQSFMTWSDAAIVDLMIHIAHENRSRTGDRIQIIGIDPLAYDVGKRLDKISAETNNALLADLLMGLKESWGNIDSLNKTIFQMLQQNMDPGSAWNDLQKEIPTCKSLIEACIAGIGNSHSYAELVLRSAFNDLNCRTADTFDAAYGHRDHLMADTILQQYSYLPRLESELKGPRAVVLAHNTHVACMSPKNSERRDGFSHGMGAIVRQKLSDNCSIVCQTVGKGALPLLPRDKIEGRTLYYPELKLTAIEKIVDLLGDGSTPSGRLPIMVPVGEIAKNGGAFPLTSILSLGAREIGVSASENKIKINGIFEYGIRLDERMDALLVYADGRSTRVV
jgi:erythromycin esterase-like protein